MGVYIKGVEMPINCDECWTKYNGFGMVEHNKEWCTFYCKLAKGFCSDLRTKCPLIPVPAHGRLIDADELHSALRKRAKEFSNSEYGDGVKCGLADAREYIKIAPTIIEAEEGKDVSGQDDNSR